MKLVLVIALGFALILFASGTADAGDRLPGSKGYIIKDTNGVTAGHISTDSTGFSFTYTPVSGGASSTWLWDGFSYLNPDTNQEWTFDNATKTFTVTGGSPSSGLSGTYEEGSMIVGL